MAKKIISFSSLTTPFLASNANPFHLSLDFSLCCQNLSSTQTLKPLSLPRKFLGFHFSGKSFDLGRKIKVLDASSEDWSVKELDDSPVSVDLIPISSETQFHQVLAEAQQLDESVIIVWMAKWCRKCIYLKPKLEKLAADYYPRLRFYCVDVNNVPHKLVAYAGVVKMPTIQLWKDGSKQSEVVGGHKAHFVTYEVREMIENEGTL